MPRPLVLAVLGLLVLGAATATLNRKHLTLLRLRHRDSIELLPGRRPHAARTLRRWAPD